MTNPARILGLAALASLVVITGLGGVHGQADGPPPPRTFGPDTYAVGTFTGAGTVAPGLTCDAPADAGTPRTCDGFLASSVDGTLLDVTVRVPQTAGLHPLVVYVHGWGATKTAGRQYDRDLTAAGYTYLRYTTRGFGRSWGQTNFGDVNVELADLRSMIGQVVDDDRLQADGGAVAVMGASYGGAHAWLAAVEPYFKSPTGRPVKNPNGKAVQIRTVVPIAAGTDLLYALIPNGRPNEATTPPGGIKLSFENGLYLTGIREPSAARPYPNYPDYLVAWHTEANATEPNYQTPTSQQMVDGLQGYRSVYWQSAFWDHVRANVGTGSQLPILMIQGFTDDLFPIHESLRMLRALRAVDPAYPIASYFGDIGHPRAVNKDGEVQYVVDLILQWLAFHLKGVGTAPTGARAAITRPASVAFDPADVVALSGYDELATSVISQQFTDVQVLTFNPANTSGFVWDPVVLLEAQELGATPPAPASDEVPGDVAAYEVPASALTAGTDGLLIAGQPTVSFVASTVAHRVQLNVRVFDVAPDGTRQLVTRGTSTLDTGDPVTPLGRVNVAIVSYGNLWKIAAANTLRLEITNVDSPYIAPSRVPSVTELADVRLDLPVR